MFLNLPETLTNLTIEDGPLYREYPVNSILKCLGSQIINLRLMFGFPKIGLQSPSIILRFAPNIRHLSLVASDFFLGAYQSTSCTTRQIESLTLFAPRTGTISEDLFGQIFEDVDHSYLDHLRRVRVSNKLGWKPGDKRWKAIQDLGDFLQALHAEALEDGVTTEPEGEAGVWMFDEEDPVQQIQKSLWKP
ncbi:hypothetical protein MMC19_007032 [Ptychographa xylographoides]|nr:hypothetical protein [Ptychographa xylographoides]